MQDYRNFGAEELAVDFFFRRWKLVRDPAACAFWEDWLIQNPDKEELVDRAVFLLSSLHDLYKQRAPLASEEIGFEINRLHQAMNTPAVAIGKQIQFPFRPYTVAACVAALLLVFGWLVTPSSPKTSKSVYKALLAQAKEPLTEVVNTSRKPLLVTLPDGSTVRLQQQSRASYPRRFAGLKREVYLSGEGFFEVVKDPSKPFYVYADNLVTKVLGTSFSVRAYDTDRQVNVVVKTGKVSVFARTEKALTEQQADTRLGGLVLTPNQQIVFSPVDTRLIRSLVADPVVLSSAVQQRPSFVFKRTPVANVFNALEQAYGIKIIFDAELLQHCQLTASLADEPFLEKVALICRTIDAQYEQLDGTLIISSKGCNP